MNDLQQLVRLRGLRYVVAFLLSQYVSRGYKCRPIPVKRNLKIEANLIAFECKLCDTLQWLIKICTDYTTYVMT